MRKQGYACQGIATGVVAVACLALGAWSCGSDDAQKGDTTLLDSASDSNDSADGTATTDTFGDTSTDTGRDTLADSGEDTGGDASVDADIEPGTFGAACNENKDCLSGWCVTSDDGPVCTRTCDADCPSGWSCLGIAGEVDVTFLCVPRQDRLCQPCLIDRQCNNGYCLTFEDGQRCSAACGHDDECP
ncbi:MAG: hypothetical protein U1F43_36695 [Myxococcota bacterium]